MYNWELQYIRPSKHLMLLTEWESKLPKFRHIVWIMRAFFVFSLSNFVVLFIVDFIEFLLPFGIESVNLSALKFQGILWICWWISLSTGCGQIKFFFITSTARIVTPFFIHFLRTAFIPCFHLLVTWSGFSSSV